MTEATLLVIDAMSVWHIDFITGSSNQIFCAFMIKFCFPSLGMASSFCLRTPHMFSIGFRSGELGGHSITWNPWSWIHFFVVLDTWHGALSWTNVHEVISSNQDDALGSHWVSRMSIYLAVLTFPTHGWRGLTPLALKQAQNICFCGNFCFWDKWLGFIFSFGDFLT